MAKLTFADLEARAKAPVPTLDKPAIKVGLSTCGIAAGAEPVFSALTATVKDRGLDWKVARTGCAGMCSMEPLVEVALPGQPPVMYGEVTPEFAAKIADAIAAGKPLPAEGRVPSSRP
jgi:(2Fe-2S) ferredoxin